VALGLFGSHLRVSRLEQDILCDFFEKVLDLFIKADREEAKRIEQNKDTPFS
jgi:hypothetical protein